MPAPVELVPLPKDAILIELRADLLSFETRRCLLPGTALALSLVLEGRTLPLHVRTNACLVTDKDRLGYIYRSQVALAQLPKSDRQIIALFIAKGRGAPQLLPGFPAR